MKQIRKILLAFVIMGTLSFSLTSCKKEPKDSDLVTKAKAVLPEGVNIDVKKGVATLSGEYNDDNAKQSTENAVKAIPGIKSVEDNATIKETASSVEVSADSVLESKVNDVLKGYTGVTADVNDGIVTLNGELNRSELPRLMQAINALQPKKIEQKLLLK
ncbi:MAG: BON domain-containing protein [Apibacter sp.]|uniref:BON domain-containing protein n=1 Tax=Apibacter sp. TaxID=2023709 RepID=UPI0025F4367C|nr:BON domain-containing protein [Apibacter sp.]MCT6870079.1 BON domain-containing protein [Apibacter sp.]